MIDFARWPALVLAAGRGTRLKPLSDVRAKAALPVAGEALVTRILKWLHAAGVRRVVLNLHHRPETITRAVGDGSALGLDVRYSWEPEALGSAGGPARALPLLAADRFLVINGDTLAGVDLRDLAGRHVASGALVTMAVVPADLTKYNAILAAPDGAMTGWTPARPAAAGGPDLRPSQHREGRRLEAESALGVGNYGHEPVHFIGLQAMNAAALAGVDPERPSDTVRGLYPALIAARPGSVRIVRTGAEFFDVGTPADYLETVRRIAARDGRPLDRGVDCHVDPSATVAGTVLWDRVRVGPHADLRDCIVADDVQIPAGARYARCAIIHGDRGVVAASF